MVDTEKYGLSRQQWNALKRAALQDLGFDAELRNYASALCHHYRQRKVPHKASSEAPVSIPGDCPLTEVQFHKLEWKAQTGVEFDAECRLYLRQLIEHIEEIHGGEGVLSSADPGPAGTDGPGFPTDEPVDLEEKTVKELKEILRGMDLKVSGRKAELIERIENAEE